MNKHKIKTFPLIFSFIQLLSYSTLTIYAQNPTFDSLANEINRISFYKKTKTLELLDSLYQIATNSQDSSLLIARYIYEKSLLNARHGIIDTLLIDKIKERINGGSSSIEENAMLLDALGINLMATGNYAESFSINLQALEKHKQTENNLLVSRTLNRLGNICHTILLYNMAKSYYSEALSMLTPDCRDYYIVKANLFMRYINNETAVVDSFLCFIEVVEKKGYEELLFMLYNNVSSYFFENNELDKAFVFLSKMLNLDFENNRILIITYGNMSMYYRLKKDYNMALKYLKNAQEIMGEFNEFYRFLYNDISLVYEEQNMYDSALFYARKHEEFNSQLRSNTIAIETHQKYITTLLETQQKDLLIANQQNKLNRSQITIIIIVSGSIILLILMLLLYVNQQKIRKSIENKALEDKNELNEKLLLSEQKQRKIEREKQEEILHSNTRELTTYSVLVSNKNRLLQRIMEFIYDKENPSKTLSKIENIVKNSLNTDDEWNNFKLHFEKVHPRFFDNLKSQCKNLTDENMKLCAYIKMKMSTKQIAQLLHVIPETVTVNKSRIKKKLQLSEKDDFDDFIGKM